MLLRVATAYVKWVFSAMSIIKIDLCDAIQRLTKQLDIVLIERDLLKKVNSDLSYFLICNTIFMCLHSGTDTDLNYRDMNMLIFTLAMWEFFSEMLSFNRPTRRNISDRTLTFN